jgi:hypothetical protein
VMLLVRHTYRKFSKSRKGPPREFECPN